MKVIGSAMISLSLLATASAAFAKDDVKWFKSEMTCAGTRIIVHSQCPDPHDSLLECENQVMTLQKPDGKVIDAGYLQAKQKHSSEVLVAASIHCVAGAEKKPYLFMSFGNGGNCDECESYGVIDLDGNWKRYGKNWYVSGAEKNDISSKESTWFNKQDVNTGIEKLDAGFNYK